MVFMCGGMMLDVKLWRLSELVVDCHNDWKWTRFWFCCDGGIEKDGANSKNGLFVFL